MIVHFIGFRDDRYWNAVKVWGSPHYVHPGWDMRALREVAPGDVLVFADGRWTDPPRRRSFTDYREVEP